MLLTFPSIASAQFLDTKWTVIGYFGELWFAEEEDILGKHQEFYKGWADGVFYSCDYAGQSATYNTHTIREFLLNKEFELVNQEKAFSKVFEENGLMNEHTEVFEPKKKLEIIFEISRDFSFSIKIANYCHKALPLKI